MRVHERAHFPEQRLREPRVDALLRAAGGCADSAVVTATVLRPMPLEEPSTVLKEMRLFEEPSRPTCSDTVVPADSRFTPLKVVVFEMRSISDTRAVNSSCSALRWESLTVPVAGGTLRLGTWQGIYLCEHRDRGGPRRIVATLSGE